MTEPAVSAPPAAWPTYPRSFVEPARRVPTKWLTYEVRYVASIVILFAGYILLILVALGLDPNIASDRETRTSALLFPIVATVVSAIVAPGRGEARLLSSLPALGSVFSFGFLISIPDAPKLIPVIVFSLFAGFMVWGWLLLRDRRAVLMLLSLAAFVVCLVVAGVVTELINGNGTLTFGWPELFSRRSSSVDPVVIESVTIWLAQAAVAALVIVASAWVGRALAARIRHFTPEQKNALLAAKAADERARYLAKHPDAVDRPAMNTMSILGFTFGLLGGWLALVFGFIALSQIKRTGERGRKLAIWGIVVALVWIVGTVLVVAISGIIYFTQR